MALVIHLPIDPDTQRYLDAEANAMALRVIRATIGAIDEHTFRDLRRMAVEAQREIRVHGFLPVALRLADAHI